MQVAANAIVDIIAPAPSAAAARTTAFAGFNFGRVLQSVLQADQENALDLLLGGPDASAAVALALAPAPGLTAPLQTPATPNKLQGEAGAVAPPAAAASQTGQRGASPPSFSLPQQASSPLQAPEWTPPGSLSATRAAPASADANAAPNPDIPPSKAADRRTNAQLGSAHAQFSPTAAAAPAQLEPTLQPTATKGPDTPSPRPGVNKALDVSQSPPAQTVRGGVALPISSAAASIMTAAAPPSLGAKVLRAASSQQPVETPPAPLIPGGGAKQTATRRAPSEGPQAREAFSFALKEAGAPIAASAVRSTAAQAFVSEPGQPSFSAEPSPQVQLGSAATAASHAALSVAAHEHAARAAPAAAQIAREIVRRFDGETTRFELRLDPPELGRVEVRLEVTRDHRVSAIVAADTQQTLSELARHARDLEQMLQSAGLQLNENGLSFDLRQSDADTAEAEFLDTSDAGDARDEQPAQILARPIGLERWRGVRLDLVV